MMACQLLAWRWFSWKKGELSNKGFLIFSVAMALGQLAASIETIYKGAWGTLFMQIWFLVFTIIGGILKYRQIRRANQK